MNVEHRSRSSEYPVTESGAAGVTFHGLVVILYSTLEVFALEERPFFENTLHVVRWMQIRFTEVGVSYGFFTRTDEISRYL